jgi:hypothetical protein
MKSSILPPAEIFKTTSFPCRKYRLSDAADPSSNATYPPLDCATPTESGCPDAVPFRRERSECNAVNGAASGGLAGTVFFMGAFVDTDNLFFLSLQTYGRKQVQIFQTRHQLAVV